MNIIDTRLHGALDYIFGLLLIILPSVFLEVGHSTAYWVPVILGGTTILYSLLTNYELCLSPKISISSHLTLDVISGMLLMVSPWVFDFWETSWIPYILGGIIEIAVASYTDVKPTVKHEDLSNGI